MEVDVANRVFGRLRFACQVLPPSSVESNVPRLPAAQPRFWLTKKTECSQANEQLRCRVQPEEA